jgi:hypothetical protein
MAYEDVARAGNATHTIGVSRRSEPYQSLPMSPARRASSASYNARWIPSAVRSLTCPPTWLVTCLAGWQQPLLLSGPKSSSMRLCGRQAKTRKRDIGLDQAPTYVSSTPTSNSQRDDSFKPEQHLSLLPLQGRVLLPYSGKDAQMALIQHGIPWGPHRPAKTESSSPPEQ